MIEHKIDSVIQSSTPNYVLWQRKNAGFNTRSDKHIVLDVNSNSKHMPMWFRRKKFSSDETMIIANRIVALHSCKFTHWIECSSRTLNCTKIHRAPVVILRAKNHIYLEKCDGYECWYFAVYFHICISIPIPICLFVCMSFCKYGPKCLQQNSLFGICSVHRHLNVVTSNQLMDPF